MTDIDQRALDSLSVAPGRDDAGQDKSIARRLEKNPESKDARLDNALDESMDASDPPASTQPSANEPAPSSGFDEEAERKLRDGG
ncbi:hypothetical protein ACT009_06400 [Sphingomonas sp. Tas61C01]|uniref:hypothetical protein n=1 Tax=Sphingomonas sp. Tas61C01 TaxID=3458297 RepID=UPI00403ED616